MIKNKLTNKIIIALTALTVSAASADDWSYNEFSDNLSGYNESRLSVTSKDLTTAIELICNQYGVQLLITASGWVPAFYDQGVSWLADSKQGGRLDIPPTDSTAGLRGTWQAITDKQPKDLLTAINSSATVDFRFKINGKHQTKTINTTGAETSTAPFLKACLLWRG